MNVNHMLVGWREMHLNYVFMMQAILCRDARKIFDCSEKYFDTEKTNNYYLCRPPLAAAAVGEEKKERLFSKKFRHCKSKVEFFEKGISLKEKGSWKV